MNVISLYIKINVDIIIEYTRDGKNSRLISDHKYSNCLLN